MLLLLFNRLYFLFSCMTWSSLAPPPLPPLMCFIHLNSMNIVFSKYMVEEGYSMLITCTFF